ncbi:1,2-phenylacetyl-CoA epoxidase subunit PaaD [Arthrobacter wenxiniae]|uniref:Phenylacetate-CoA oxygenase subunit PaaJ n=1 Tax=Arthrobacter wenxiniae TaxID=2713570 RepID=A0A7Y7LXX5_9MICC|nr:phenylacetate-CoA oxygenase subunit PaaJ [Arthrobacter wenxiniae]
MSAVEVQEKGAPRKTAQQQAWDIAARVCDPEIPVLTIADLGILRSVEVHDAGTPAASAPRVDASRPAVRVTITPTYSGCPALDAIRDDVVAEFAREGQSAEVVTVLSPAWTTDWMSAAGRAKLEEYGIAPPSGHSRAGGHSGPVRLALAVKCPQCQSLHTKELTRFGSTSCKALYVCQDCKEPFDYFKVL